MALGLTLSQERLDELVLRLREMPLLQSRCVIHEPYLAPYGARAKQVIIDGPLGSDDDDTIVLSPIGPPGLTAWLESNR